MIERPATTTDGDIQSIQSAREGHATHPAFSIYQNVVMKTNNVSHHHRFSHTKSACSIIQHIIVPQHNASSLFNYHIYEYMRHKFVCS